MRILLVSIHYPPDPAVGATRAARVAAALAAAGHEVEVLTVRRPGLTASTPGDAATAVHRVPRLPNARELALRMRARVRRGTRGPQPPEAGGWVVADDIPGWRRFLVAMALLPDEYQGFILPGLLRALRLARHADLVYTSGPPHSAHVVGLLVKRLTGVRWAAEFRDPWTDNAVQPRYAVSETAFAVKRWLERQTLAAADHVIAVSESAAALFAARAPAGRNGRIAVVRNGILVTEAPSRSASGGGIRVLYLGSLYHARDPRPFFEALASLRASGERSALAARVELIGECRILRGRPVEDTIRELGLADIVRIEDAVPRARVPGLMADADLLLLLAQQQPLQVPAKLYEYLASRRPMLAFADEDGETAAMLRRVGGHFLVTTSDPAAIRDTLRAALAAAARGGEAAMDECVLAEWSADRQMSRLVALLEPARAAAAPR